MPPALLTPLQAQLDRMYRDQALDAYFALNQEIHRTIVTAARVLCEADPSRAG